MSYEIRNTLILILILLLLSSGGYLGLHLRYDEKIEVLEQQIEQKEKEYSKLEGYLADLDYYYEEIKTNQERLKSYPKILLPTVEIHQTYRYLEYLDRLGTFFNFTFVLTDIKEKKGYAEAIYQLSGEGKFPKLAAFFMRLEKLKPIYRIDNFRFMPLILGKLPPNSDNLPIVEKCNLIAITGNVAYIKDQSNNLLKLKVDDKIYLGYLAKVNINKGTVTFKMDRGGIKDTVVFNLNPTK
jgi:Tfp pilus assembly protein PilO